MKLEQLMPHVQITPLRRVIDRTERRAHLQAHVMLDFTEPIIIEDQEWDRVTSRDGAMRMLQEKADAAARVVMARMLEFFDGPLEPTELKVGIQVTPELLEDKY